MCAAIRQTASEPAGAGSGHGGTRSSALGSIHLAPFITPVGVFLFLYYLSLYAESGLLLSAGALQRVVASASRSALPPVPSPSCGSLFIPETGNFNG